MKAEIMKYKRIQLFGYPNTGKSTLLNSLIRLKNTTSKIPGTTTHFSEHKYSSSTIIYDMPGVYVDHLLYNLISKPTQKALLTWHKFFSPGLLTHSAMFFGGKVEIFGVRILVVGLGGSCSESNEWFLLNYKEFWKGLPDLAALKIKKYQFTLEFKNGETDDLEIEGFGFIGFRLP